MQTSIISKVDLDLGYIFDYISDSNSLAPIIFDADLHALKFTEEFEDEYYKIFWFKTEYLTKLQLNFAARTLSSLIYSAWVDADKPGID